MEIVLTDLLTQIFMLPHPTSKFCSMLLKKQLVLRSEAD